MAALTDVMPLVHSLEVDRRRYGEERRDVPRALPLIAAHECMIACPAPTNRRRFHPIMMLWRDVEKGRSLWCAEPLVEVPGVDIGAERGEVERELAGNVSAIDDG